MYNKKKRTEIKNTSLQINESIEGESIEEKFERIMENGEGIQGQVPMIYTEKKEGVNPAYNIRSDRFEIAVEGFDAISRSRIAKRDHYNQEETKVVDINKTKENNSGDGEGIA